MAVAIDQTESERRLHRALYFVKYLRAMVLNIALGIVAIALFAVAGVRGLYPLTDDTIDAMAAQMEQLSRQGDPLGGAFVPLVGSITSVLLVAFFLWVYLSITKVWRISLRLQAAYLLGSARLGPVWMWPQLEFALEHLNPGFAALAALSYAVMIAMVIDVALALWGVSRSPERSSFVATLDPRLAPGAWAWLNKLLDLPRTPFRNPRAVAAYALAFLGAIVLIASIMYLVSVGVVHNKLGQLWATCAPVLDPDCLAEARARSAAWAWEIPLWLAVALAGLRAAALMQSLAKRLGGLGVSDVLRGAGDRFLLYLRPFDSDDVVLPKPKLPPLSRLLSFRPFPARIEEELFDVADGYRPLIAVGKPGATGTGGVAYRAWLEDSEWQGYVADKIRRADAIVLLLKDTDGVRWELAKIIAEGAAGKTLFLFDPAAKDPAVHDSLAARMLPPLVEAGLAPPGFAFAGRPLGFFLADGVPAGIVNAHWTATSYRTAFSSFLAERAVAAARPPAEDRRR
jgi:hypothetical protein